MRMTNWRRVADLRALPDGAPYPVTLDAGYAQLAEILKNGAGA